MPDNDDQKPEGDKPEGQKPEGDKPEGTPPAGNGDDDKGGDDVTIPKSKYDQAWAAKKKAEREAEEAKRKLAEYEDEKAREKGEHKELADKYKSERDAYEAQLKEMEERDSRYKEIMTEQLNSQLEEIPEEMRSLIPEDMSIEAKLQYISSNRSILMAGKKAAGDSKRQPDGEEPPAGEKDRLKSELQDLYDKRRKHGGLSSQDSKRVREVTRKLAELKT